MKMLFIGCFYPEEYKAFFAQNVKKSTIQNALNTYQCALLKGFSQNQQSVYALTFPALGCCPFHYKKINTPSYFFEHDTFVYGEMVSYLTIPLLKNISIRHNLYHRAKKWIESNVSSEEDLCILTYTPQSDFIYPLKKIKKLYPQVQIASIVTDLVDDLLMFKTNRSFFKRIQGFIECRNVKSLYKSIDKFVLLTQAMIDKIPEANNRFVVIEGIPNFNFSKSEKINKVDSEKKVILYTGILEDFSGVRMLLNAFMKTKNPSYRLVICGTGSLKQFVIDCAKRDSRIIFKGLILQNDVLKWQRESTVLINPRLPDKSITYYSFPSKTMEYMTSGTPMIGYHLKGIPREYYGYFFTPKDESEESLTNLLEDVLKKGQSELDSFAQKAFDFIKKEKNSKMQTKKIIDFLQSRKSL